MDFKDDHIGKVGEYLKMLHIDGSETFRRFLKSRSRSSTPENKIIYNMSRKSLSQVMIMLIFIAGSCIH